MHITDLLILSIERVPEKWEKGQYSCNVSILTLRIIGQDMKLL